LFSIPSIGSLSWLEDLVGVLTNEVETFVLRFPTGPYRRLRIENTFGNIALDDPCQTLMKTAMRQLQLTARAYLRVLKLSRTIVDLAGSEAITQVHLAEALQYRTKLDLM